MARAIPKDEVVARLGEQRVLPLFNCASADDGMKVVVALHRAGLRAIEFTNRRPEALEVFTAMVKRAAGKFPDQEFQAKQRVRILETEMRKK